MTRPVGAAVVLGAALILGLAAFPAGAASTFAAATGPATSVTQTSSTLTGTVVTGGADTTVTTTAVTEPATSIGTTTVQLNGIVYTGGRTTQWDFEFGTSTKYNLHASIQSIPAGVTGTWVVKTALTYLTPGTTYHFRLVALFGTPPAQNDSLGGDATFTTAAVAAVTPTANGGVASLTSRTIIVEGGTAGVSMRCSGGRGAQCRGRISLSARGEIGGKAKTVSCGSGGYSSSAGHTHVVGVNLPGSCGTLLQAKKGRLAATFKATFTHQGGIRLGVTLRT